MLKELAKFGDGVAFWEAVVHLSFTVGGILPLQLFGIVITPKINTIQIIIPLIVSGILAYFAWGSKPK